MGFIHELRVPLHMTVAEFQVAQLFMVVEASENFTGNGEGVQILKNEPYDNTDGHMGISPITHWPIPRTKGQYTCKQYYIKSHVPKFIAAICPEDSMILTEEAWNAYPHCTTVLVNGFLSHTKFYISVESMHLPDRGDTANALDLSPRDLKKRTVETLDVAVNTEKQGALKDDTDPSTFVSAKTSRGPLSKGWIQHVEPIMTCYKLIRANFEYWGFQGRVESIMREQMRQLFHTTLRQAYCATDRWFGLTMEDIRRLEESVVAKLEAKRAKMITN